MIDVNKQVSNDSNSNPMPDYIEKMHKAVEEICNILNSDSNSFDANKLINILKQYNKNKYRLLYSDITNFIFELKEENYSLFQTNLEKAIHFINHKSDYKGGKKPKQNNNSIQEEYELVEKLLYKIWDHSNLAKRQYVIMRKEDNFYNKIVEEKMKAAEILLTKEMNMQLISLIAIFTALSFLVFGGISSLDNIFIGAKDIPIIKLLIIGSIWCFCIMNLIFVFMFFISKLTNISLKSIKSSNANLIQRHPLICWCNFFILVLFVICTWIYYIDSEGLSSGVFVLIEQHKNVFFTLGSIIILALIFFIGYKLYKSSKPTELKNKENT